MGAGGHAGLVDPGAGFFQGMAVPVHGVLHKDRIIADGGVTQTVPDALEDLAHDLVLHFGVPAESEGGVGHANQPGGLEKGYGHVVAGVLAVLLHSTQGPNPGPVDSLEAFLGPAGFVLPYFGGPDEELTHEV